ncbi:MAG TPA: MoaD/ThiS family protein [Ornithinibacter sp.]|nr:MoaD/ThiS family protein [Ornithinibacter sp.]
MQSSEGVDRVTETVLVRYWAGARAAAGLDEERLTDVATVADLVARLSADRPALAAVLPVCSVLVGGRAGAGDDPVPPGAVVEVLPPFAGG